MNKKNWRASALAAVLALALLLTACAQTSPETTPSDETTLPTQLTSSPETTESDTATDPEEPTSPTVTMGDFSEYEALLNFSSDPNWLARSLGCLYEKPEDIDLYYMFYLGVDQPGSWGDISAESRQSLIEQGFMEEFDLQFMPAENLEEALQSTFGIGLDDVSIPEEWGYIEAEDAYCTNHSDAYFPGIPVITAVEDDGVNICIHYTIDSFWVPDTQEFLDTAYLVMTLVRNDDGTIYAVSNLFE